MRSAWEKSLSGNPSGALKINWQFYSSTGADREAAAKGWESIAASQSYRPTALMLRIELCSQVHPTAPVKEPRIGETVLGS